MMIRLHFSESTFDSIEKDLPGGRSFHYAILNNYTPE